MGNLLVGEQIELQSCAPRRSKLQHQEAATSAEQRRSSDRSRGSITIPRQRQPVAEDVTLATRSAGDRLQSGSADVQSSQHVDAVDRSTSVA